jgi:hypothetical protein
MTCFDVFARNSVEFHRVCREPQWVVARQPFPVAAEKIDKQKIVTNHF